MTDRGKGRLLAVVGPSGVGKDSVMAALIARKPEIGLVRRVITRGAGATGEDAEPVDAARFEALVRQGAFWLHWRAHGLRYGIPARVLADLAAGQSLVVNLSRSVLLQAQARVEHLTVIHLTAPPAILADRLTRRGRERPEEIEDRLARADHALPDGLRHVLTVSNAGALSATVAAILARLQPERAMR